MDNQKKKSKNGNVALGSAIAGAALGAAAVYLSDKKNQQKIKKTLNDVSTKASDVGKQIQRKVNKFQEATEEKVEKVGEELGDFKKDLETETQKAKDDVKTVANN